MVKTTILYVVFLRMLMLMMPIAKMNGNGEGDEGRQGNIRG